ncbi:hypothetical protein N2152v2_007039 [Parachlorella kessleri]
MEASLTGGVPAGAVGDEPLPLLVVQAAAMTAAAAPAVLPSSVPAALSEAAQLPLTASSEPSHAMGSVPEANGGSAPAAVAGAETATATGATAALAAHTAGAAATAAPTRRSQRTRDKFSIYNEDLMFEIHNELLGLDGGPGGRSRRRQAASGNRAGQQQQPPSSRRSKGGGETGADDDADSRRPAKRSRSMPTSGSDSDSGHERMIEGSSDSGLEYGLAVDPNAETAWAVGLNAVGLADQEEGLLPEGADEASYARVRNLILSRWRSDVSRFMSEKQALAGLPKKDRPYGLAAWRFLHSMGYINFGVSPDVADEMASQPDSKGTVVVVGAGCAGLAAARQLRMLGYRVAVVEGRDRPGGRVHTLRMQGRGVAAVADLGGSIITGIDGNPLATLVKQMGVNMLDIRTDTPLFMTDGSEADKALDQAIETYHNYLLDECSRTRDELPEDAADLSLGDMLESLWQQHLGSLLLDGQHGIAAQTARKLFNWHLANLEFANASLVPRLSLKFWDQDDPNELLGAHTFVPGGNGRWVAKLCEGLPIFYNSPVTHICYGSPGKRSMALATLWYMLCQEARACRAANGVAVHTGGGRVFEAEAVVVTVPLGVLKRGSIAFCPPLPQRKVDTIERLGFGVLNKVIMLFPYAFWSDKIDMFGRVADAEEERGEAFLFYSYANIAGGALLIGLVAGKAALRYEQLPPGDAAQRVMGVLRSIYEPRGVAVPPPLEVVCTRWGSDPFCYGAYSSMAVGTVGGEDYSILGESLGGRVFFAGEATTNKYPATMHGAFYTGLQAAANVDASLRKEQQPSPTPAQAAAEQLALGSPTNGAATGEQNGTVLSEQQHHHHQQQQQQQRRLDEEALQPALHAVAAQQEQAAQLQHLFQAPDLEFGCFAAVHGPPASEHAGQSLMRVDIGAAKGGPRRSLPIYLAVDRQLALGLADTPGDDNRVALLATLPEVKLTGRQGLSANAEALLGAVLASRQPQPQQHGRAREQEKPMGTPGQQPQLNGHAGPAPAAAAAAAMALPARSDGVYVIPRLGSGPPPQRSMPVPKQPQLISTQQGQQPQLHAQSLVSRQPQQLQLTRQQQQQWTGPLHLLSQQQGR